MESKYNFKELMKERHSARIFQSKKIPEEVLKDIISISLHAPSWCNSQPWTIYVATGNTLEEIRKEWIAKHKENIKDIQIFLQDIELIFQKDPKAQWPNSIKYGKICPK